MNKPVDPKKFGLHPSTKIDQSDDNHFIIRIERKSRIIMNDGKKILDKILKIKVSLPDAVVSVYTTAPVCSKTIKFFEEHHVRIKTT